MQRLLWLGIPVWLGAMLMAQRSPRPAPTYEWNPVRIVAGGYVPSIVAHPTEPGLMYLRTDIGGVYRWNAGQKVWVPLLDWQSPANYNLNGPESVALDPTDPNRLYIAAGMYTCNGCPFAFLVSTDRGATFSTYPAPFPMGANNDGRAAGERLAVNPFNPAELFIGTRTKGLWRSEDRAQTWTQVSGFPVQSSSDGFGVQWVLFDANHSGVVYAGSYTNSSVYSSADGGATWTALPGRPGARSPNRGILNPDGSLYLTYGDLPGPNAMNSGSVQKYNPSTGGWTNITPPDYTGHGGFSGLTQDPNRSGTIAVSTFARWYPVDTVYITHDGGKTWIDLGMTTSAAGFKGPNAGNYYFNPSVFTPLSPWLTFGNTSSPSGSAKFGWWMSALLIDPTSPDHLMFGTGATVYATDNVSAADAGKSPSWYVQGMGIEETAVLALISPTQGAHLLSGMGDIGGFRHDDFTISPPAGMYTNPVATTVGSLDWAGQAPLTVTRTQSPSTASTSPCNYGAWSADGGSDWSPFPSCAAGVNSGNGGTVAVDAGGSMFMWTAPSGTNKPQYSLDNGVTWSSAAGLPGRITAVADKVLAKTFYAFSGGAFYSTTSSGGTVFTALNQSPLPSSGSGTMAVNLAKAGDIWLPLGSHGLYHSTDGGVTWTQIAGIQNAGSVAIGAAGPGSTVQSVYLYNTGIYRSDDNGATWLRINDDQHQYGGPTLIAADSRVFGRVFLGMNGRGIIYGDAAERTPRRVR